MGGSAEAGQPQGLPVLETGQAQGAVADGPGAEERGGLRGAENRRDGVDEGFRDAQRFGVPAVGVAARGAKLRAEILAPAAAERAFPAGGEDPGRADAGFQWV